MEAVVEEQIKEYPQGNAVSRSGRGESLRLTRGQIHQFLKELERAGRSEKTIDSYRQNILSFYEFLGTKKELSAQSLPGWREWLVENGYSQNSIKSRLSAVNSLYNFLGKRNWQVPVGKHAKPEQGPVLNREEYLRLLQEAKQQENIQIYLLIKVLATTDLTPSDISLLTREAVNAGAVSFGSGDLVELPGALREELLEYARLWGLRSGPIFLNGEKKCYGRTAITRMIVRLAEDLGIEPGKANPRNLRRMHLTTLADFQKQAQLWVNAQYSLLLAEEEAKIGWRV